MQNINIIITNAKGDVIENTGLNFVPILEEFNRIDNKEKYPFISSIDPYGDTTFNHIQREYFLTEIKNIPIENKYLLNKIIVLLESLNEQKYIKFIGD